MTEGYEVFFDGVPLHDYILITGVEESILPPRTNLSKSIPSMAGEHYLGHKYGVREVKIKGFLEASNQADRNEGLSALADILNVSSPAKVVTSKNPDKFFYAVPDKINQDRIIYNEEIEIILKLYDVYKYALEDDFFQPDEKKIVSIVNGGSVEAYPITSIEFLNKAYFIQCTSYTGETILIGQRPSVDKTNSTGDTIALSEPCESMTNWLPAGNVIEPTYQVTGTGQVNAGGYGIICNDYGTSSSGWHGVALRRNIGSNVRDFEISLTLEHNSKGDVKGTGSNTTPPVTSAKYQVTAEPCLRLRRERNTSSAILTKIPTGKVVTVSEIQNNWGKTTYNSQTGYIYMQHTKKYVEPTVETYTLKATENVNVRSGAGTKYKILTTAKKGTTTTAKSNETKNGWYRVTVNGRTGYTTSKYWTKTKVTKSKNTRNVPSAENRVGRLEVYGFGQNQERLFRCVLRDSEDWYEYTQPEIFIGSTLVLDDAKATPKPKTTQVEDKNNQGKYITKNVDSGRFGDWNEFYGNFKIKRTTNSSGQQVWQVSVEKIENGKVVRTLSSNSLINTKYPTAELNNVVVWFGQWNDSPVVDTMSINHVEVKNLVPYKPQENRPIFWAGDELVINHDTHKVYLNGRPFMEELDIGSQFFSVPTGESQFIFATDDNDADIEVALTKKYL